MKKTVICIVGPTGSGKTSLSIKLAKKVNGEIVSADSMQIYKGLDIGTAKITENEKEGIKHHMIDICEIHKKFSVADFKAMCYDKIEEIIKQNKIPIIVGGTGLYISAIVNNMNFEEQVIDEEYRNMLYSLAKEKSNDYLHDMLKEIDPESAEKIHKNNVKRVIRALEISKFGNKLKSIHMESEIARINGEDSKYDFKIYAYDFDREILYERINKRVDIMIADGVLIEAKEMFLQNLPNDYTCMQAIGYKEFFPYFKGENTLENCIENLRKETRNYAKRQITWFKNKLDVNMLDPNENIENNIQRIVKDMND